VADVAARWGLEIGESPPNASEAFVAFARTADGREAVLKIVIPGVDPARQELRALRAAAGRGYAALLRADDAANVMLLERLGGQLAAMRLPKAEELAAIAATLREAWALELDGAGFATTADRAIEFAATIRSLWEILGRPCAAATFERALDCAERRAGAYDPAASVVLHGDAHQWNTLQAADSATGFKFVDPDGAFGERAFDLAIAMREWPEGLPDGDLMRAGEARCETLSQLSGVDPRPIWEWSLVQLVWNGLLLKEVGAEAPAAASLAIADAWAR
jgi:streptomycin 6-kinase